jgi:drug/metabolite transporter (DMT)-like permease
MLSAGASLVYSIYVVCGNKILKKVSSLTASAYVALFSALGFLFSSIFSQSLKFNFHPAAWPWILGLAAFSTVLAILTFFRGLEILGPTKATILSTAEPVFGVIIAMILFYEKLSVLQFIGAIGVIAGAILAAYTKDIQAKDDTAKTASSS